MIKVGRKVVATLCRAKNVVTSPRGAKNYRNCVEHNTVSNFILLSSKYHQNIKVGRKVVANVTSREECCYLPTRCEELSKLHRAQHCI